MATNHTVKYLGVTTVFGKAKVKQTNRKKFSGTHSLKAAGKRKKWQYLHRKAKNKNWGKGKARYQKFLD